ncbi:MAG: beta-lactamase family protein [Deltaproteobacteria bacterium]|nr:beta-lactamase family protein [Deltaproteobacteria bacterium]
MRTPVLLLAFALALPAASQPVDPAQADLPDTASLETFLDGLIPGLLLAHHAPGAVISIVQGDEVVLAKGYGQARTDDTQPMTADTRMRVASISKLFTATAALQLVEQGKLDLHADVNDVLDFELASPFDEPITLHHLLTHTAGFDDRFVGTAVPHGEEAVPLGEYLAEHMPPVVMRPGHTLSYSNHGLALVARLVELASGQSFEEYLSEHVFAPLEMHASTFGVPYPVRDDQARPYIWSGSGYRELWFDRLNDGPAGDLNTTARDMANFAIAHLHGGRFRGHPILKSETAALMHAQHFTHDPRVLGWGYGFSELSIGGEPGIGHGGWVLGFHSRLWLLHERGRAVFISINSEPTGPFFDDLTRAWTEWAGPRPNPPAAPRTDLADARDAWLGVYVPNRRTRSTFMSMLSLGQHVTVQPDDAGGLTLSGPLSPTRHLILEEHDLARVKGQSSRAVLRENPGDGRPQLVIDSFALDRVDGLEDPRLHIAVWAVAVIFGASTILGWLLGGLARRIGGAPPSPLGRTARLVGILAAALLVAIPVGLLAFVNDAPSVFAVWMGVPAGLRLVLWLPLVLGIVGLLLPLTAIRGVRSETRPVLPRLHFGLLVLLSWALFASSWAHHMRGPWSF